MREVNREFDLPVSLDRAIEAAYGVQSVIGLYGNETHVGAWDSRGRRRLHIQMPKPQAADACKVLRLGNEAFIPATLHQRIIRSEPNVMHEVRGWLRLKVLAAELIKIRPRTILTSCDNNTKCRVSTTVEMHAVLPPPFNRLIENIMAERASSELERFVGICSRNTLSS